MAELATKNFSAATEVANYLVRDHNVPFREAHHIVGSLVGKLYRAGKNFDDLNEKQKQVITLVKIDGYSLKEAATRLNMTVSNVKVTIHRSINKIKDGIKK